jgi:hypothetical protein
MPEFIEAFKYQMNGVPIRVNLNAIVSYEIVARYANETWYCIGTTNGMNYYTLYDMSSLDIDE